MVGNKSEEFLPQHSCSDINEITKKVSIVFFVLANFFFFSHLLSFVRMSRIIILQSYFSSAVRHRSRVSYSRKFSSEKPDRVGFRRMGMKLVVSWTWASSFVLFFFLFVFFTLTKTRRLVKGLTLKKRRRKRKSIFPPNGQQKKRRGKKTTRQNDPLSDVSLCSTRSDSIRNVNSCLCSLTKNGQNFPPVPPCFSLFSRSAPHTFISFSFKWKYNHYMLCFDRHLHNIVCCGGRWVETCAQNVTILAPWTEFSSQSYHSVKNGECFTSVSHSL